VQNYDFFLCEETFCGIEKEFYLCDSFMSGFLSLMNEICADKHKRHIGKAFRLFLCRIKIWRLEYSKQRRKSDVRV